MRFGIYANLRKVELHSTLEHLLHLLSPEPCATISSLREYVGNRQVTFYDSANELAANSDIIVSLGGDGTMLTAARAIMRENPAAKLVGVNLGHLGFISEHSPNALEELIVAVKQGTMTEENRLVLEGLLTSESNEKTGVLIRRDDLTPTREGERGDSARAYALNEIVIDNFGSTRMLTFEIRVQGSLLGTLRADGILVSTPTGSTGYSVSAGGPIVEPTSPVLIISPIAAHSLTVRPVVVPEWYEIDLRIYNDASSSVLAVADGQEEVVIETPAIVRLSGHQNRLKLLRHPSQSYFDLLRNKLLWSADIRGLRA